MVSETVGTNKMKLEAATGFEPVVKVLQTSALPLGYAATGAEDGIRTRDPHLGKVVFYHWTTSAIING
jgi:hypothetical protein